MELCIIDAKTTVIYVKAKKANGKETSRKVTVGTRIELNDGIRVKGKNGYTYTGRGTIIRFSFQHRTWSVERPQSQLTDYMGYCYSPDGSPIFVPGKRETGFTEGMFRQNYSATLVAIAKGGQLLAAA